MVHSYILEYIHAKKILPMNKFKSNISNKNYKSIKSVRFSLIYGYTFITIISTSYCEFNIYTIVILKKAYFY